MCLAYRIQKKTVSPIGAKSFFVPCGKCEECRKVVKNAWAFRLRSELEWCIKHDYNTMFWTMTYNSKSLPRLGADCLRGDYIAQIDSIQSLMLQKKKVSKGDVRLMRDFKRIINLPCFSRDDVEKFVHALREWLWREYDVKDVSYFGAAEFGSHTQRPHYHFLLSLPPSVDPRKVFDFIKAHWVEKGHIFPRYFEGGRDSKGYNHKPFVVQSPMASARYCAKYATKDLYYSEFLLNNGLHDGIVDLKSRITKRKMVFHVQKKSLGAVILQGMSDAKKFDLYTIGHAFVDDDKMSKIPVYVKNKLVYDNYYIYEPATISKPKDGKELGVIALAETYNFKRLVRRKASEFFNNNAKKIFEYKIKTYTEFFKNFCDRSMYERRGISPEFIEYGLQLMGYLSSVTSFDELAQLYLLYDGVPKNKWLYVDKKDRYLLYLLRYTQAFAECDFESFESPRVSHLLDVLGMAIHCYYLNPLSITEAQRLEDRISDFFKSQS